MRQLIITLLAILLVGTAAQAQGRSKLSNENRQKYLEEMRQIKHEFLVKELQLTREQQNEFFPLYDKMDDELTQIGEEIRTLENKVLTNEQATDAEVENAARMMFEQKAKEGAVEIQYFDKFKAVLTPRQLLSLKSTERKFTQHLMRQHGKSKKQ